MFASQQRDLALGSRKSLEYLGAALFVVDEVDVPQNFAGAAQTHQHAASVGLGAKHLDHAREDPEQHVGRSALEEQGRALWVSDNRMVADQLVDDFARQTGITDESFKTALKNFGDLNIHLGAPRIVCGRRIILLPSSFLRSPRHVPPSSL